AAARHDVALHNRADVAGAHLGSSIAAPRVRLTFRAVGSCPTGRAAPPSPPLLCAALHHQANRFRDVALPSALMGLPSRRPEQEGPLAMADDAERTENPEPPKTAGVRAKKAV